MATPAEASLPGWRRSASPAARLAFAAGRLAARLRALGFWRRAGVAALLGALAALALPPVHAVPLLWVAFTGLIWLLDGRGWRSAAATGWWFGLGHFLVGFYWIAEALLTDPWRFGWMIPFAVGGLAAYMALFTAAACGLSRLAWPGGAGRVLVLAIAWTGGEWLRGRVATGFPWDLLGYSGAFSDAVMQSAVLAGAWGLSLVTVVIAGLPATLVDPPLPAAAAPGGEVRPPRLRPHGGGLAIGAALALVALLWTGGAMRLAAAPGGEVPGVRLRLVQPAISVAQKADQDRRVADFRYQLALSRSPGVDRITHFVWPETATRFLVEREPAVRDALAQLAPPGGAVITGAPRAAPLDGPIEQLWNSLEVIDRQGRIETFDKFHLVPLGEYVPLRGLFPFLSKITPGDFDFSAGSGPRTLAIPGAPPAAPLICYEVIFPGQVVDRANRPGWIVNITNDAWFGMSSGPYQHFASARFRAVEEGLPLVRAANDGISGIVDPYGRVTAVLGLGRAGIVDGALPRPAPGLTPYARYGDWTLALALLLAATMAAGLSYRTRSSGGGTF
ncbi:MAG: apolipoprotein N-acyltransferase [Dongiaceae bacterium]